MRTLTASATARPATLQLVRRWDGKVAASCAASSWAISVNAATISSATESTSAAKALHASEADWNAAVTQLHVETGGTDAPTIS